MKGFFLFLIIVGFSFSCSSDRLDKEIDAITDNAEDDVKDEVDDAVDDVVAGLPELNGRFVGSAQANDKSFNVDVLIDDDRLSIQLKDDVSTFIAEGSILISVNSSGKKNLEILNTKLTWSITTSDYPNFLNSEVYSGIIKLNDNDLSLEFNFTPGSSPSGFGQGDWRCSAQKE